MHESPPHTQRVLSTKLFEGSLEGKAVGLTQLRNANGASVSVCNYGARVVQIVMPDAQGRMGDVALGFDDLASLLRPSPTGVPSMGAFIGRYANRIANAAFTMDGRRHSLSANSGAHCIHGGAAGSRYAVFAMDQVASNCVALKHRFLSEDDGFPGGVDLTLRYTLSEHNALHITWSATALDAATVASLTSHIFFNLAGTACSVENHVLQLQAAQYLALNAQHIPTGELTSVGDTPFDFRAPRSLGAALAQPHPQLALCNGFDHHYAVDGWDGSLREVACVTEPSSGRKLHVLSTEPGVQFFTANGLSEADCGFAPRSGFCLEPSYFPDSPNQPQFPTTRIEAGSTRRGEIVYAFGVHATAKTLSNPLKLKA